MPDRIQAAKVLCQGGLNKNDNSFLLSAVSPGSGASLINYETNQSGGYRRINGYSKLSASFAEVTSAGDPAEGKVLGIWVFYNNTSEEYEYIAARKLTSGNTYKFYLYNASTGWSAFSTGMTHVYSTDIYRVRGLSFNFGIGNHMVFVDGVNKAVIYNGTNWYALDSTNTGGTGDPGGDQVVDDPIVVAVFKQSLFLARGAIISYSAPTDPFTWTAAAGGGQQIFEEEVVNIKPFRDRLFVWGSGKIGEIEGFVDSSGNNSGFLFNAVTGNLGCISRDSLIEVGGNLLFMAPDGIHPIAGTQRNDDIELSLLSENIQSIMDNIIDSYQMDEIVAINIQSKTQFRLFVSDASDAVSESYGILGCLRVNGTDGPIWEFFELMGIRANCVWSGIVAGQEVILHGDYNGLVYVQESTNSFDGGNIMAVYTTPYLDFGDTEIRKTFRKWNTFIKPEGSATLDMAVRYDWGSSYVLNPRDYTDIIIANAPKYGNDFEYDDGSVYGGARINRFTQNVEGSGYSIQISYVSDGVFSPYTIQGFVPEFTTKGRN